MNILRNNHNSKIVRHTSEVDCCSRMAANSFWDLRGEDQSLTLIILNKLKIQCRKCLGGLAPKAPPIFAPLVVDIALNN